MKAEPERMIAQGCSPEMTEKIQIGGDETADGAGKTPWGALERNETTVEMIMKTRGQVTLKEITSPQLEGSCPTEKTENTTIP